MAVCDHLLPFCWTVSPHNSLQIETVCLFLVHVLLMTKTLIYSMKRSIIFNVYVILKRYAIYYLLHCISYITRFLTTWW